MEMFGLEREGVGPLREGGGGTALSFFLHMYTFWGKAGGGTESALRYSPDELVLLFPPPPLSPRPAAGSALPCLLNE